MIFAFPTNLVPHLKHGVKMGLAGVLSYQISHSLDLLYPYIAAVSAVIVLQAYVSESIQMAAYRVVGTMLGALISVALLLLYPQNVWAVSLGLFIGLGMSGALTNYNGNLRIVGVTVALVYLIGLDVDDKLAVALERVAEIVIGVMCAVVVSILVWPRRASRRLWAAQSELYMEAATQCGVLLEAFLDGQREVDIHSLDRLDELLHTCRSLLPKALGREANPAGNDSQGLLVRMDLATAVRDDLHAMAEALVLPSGAAVDFLLAPNMQALGTALQAELSVMASVKPGQNLRTLAELDDARQAAAAALAAADARLDEVHRTGTTSRREMPKLRQFFAFYHSLRSLTLALAQPPA